MDYINRKKNKNLTHSQSNRSHIVHAHVSVLTKHSSAPQAVSRLHLFWSQPWQTWLFDFLTIPLDFSLCCGCMCAHSKLMRQRYAAEGGYGDTDSGEWSKESSKKEMRPQNIPV